MHKRILFVFSLLLWFQFTLSQDQVGCSQLLEDAREAYAAGMVELVPDLLLPCLEGNNLSGKPKQDAFKLVINSYLFDYLPEEADGLMDEFVEQFPEYRAESTDPTGFVLMLNEHLVARGIDPNETPEQEEPVVADRPSPQELSRPQVVKEPFDYANSAGFVVGANLTLPMMIEQYSLGDPALDEGSFEMGPGFQIGGNVNLLLGRAVNFSAGLLYDYSTFSYTANPLSFTSYTYTETQGHLHLPVSFAFILNPESTGAAVYLRVGLAADYLLSAKGSGIRSYSETLRDVEIEDSNLIEARGRLNLNGLAGLGIRVPFEKSFLFFETRYVPSVFRSNVKENRYLNQDLTWLLFHVDSDFRLQQFGLYAGMAWIL